MTVPLLYHLQELRFRISSIAVSVVCSFIICYHFAEEILYLMALPLLSDTNNIRFIYTHLSDGFFTIVTLSITIALLTSLPITLFHVWLFMVPGCYKYEKHIWSILFTLLLGFWSIGAVLCYFVILPQAWSFFMTFLKPSAHIGYTLSFEARMNEYVDLFLQFVLILALMFEAPVVMVVVLHLRFLEIVDIYSGRKLMMLVAFTFATILSPPDIISQLCIGVALVCLCEATLFLVTWLAFSGNDRS